MKTNFLKTGKKPCLIIATITSIPNGADEEFGDTEGQEINKDPVIGGADDVYRENPTDDLRDSDLADAEPLQEDIDQVEKDNKKTNRHHETAKLSTPSDSEDENIDITNMEDNEDIMAED